MNNGIETFVFKSSTAMAKLAIQADRSKSGELHTCFAHIDVKHRRVRDMKTVTLWLVHPVMRKLLRLAVMD